MSSTRNQQLSRNGPKRSSPNNPGLIDDLYSLADRLDEPLRTPARMIVNILVFAVIAIIAVVIISAFVTAFAGPETGQLVNQSKSVLYIGACTIAAIIGITKEVFNRK